MPFPYDPALDLSARGLLAALDAPIAIADIDATETARLDLEDRCPALLRVVATDERSLLDVVLHLATAARP